MGESGASRTDFQASEDDNILVQGVSGDPWALGYLGYAYYRENEERLGVVAVDGGDGCVEPTDRTIDDGSYRPLSRPLFIYVKHDALQRPAVRAFMEFTVENAPEVVPSTGYLALSAEAYAEDMERLLAAEAAATR
jgi:phosphate transport system substrate-binding protein